MPRVRIGRHGALINLDARDVLGEGGEATVYRVTAQNKALKLYHRPNRQIADKLGELLRRADRFPRMVVVPNAPVFDEGANKLIGFTMPLLASNYQVLDKLAIRKIRETQKISARQVMGIFVNLHAAISKLHQELVIVGDLNPFNEMFLGEEVRLIDADSFQFGAFPCPVATEKCLDPRLYGQDLSSRPSFIPNDDWYAYWVLLFQSLLLVHPYGGVHRTLRTIPKRALARMTVFDAKVIYPDSAYPREILSDDLLNEFHQVFGEGKRGKPALGLLEGYKNALISCSVCGTFFPTGRKICPSCKAANLSRIRPQVVVSGISSTNVLETLGNLVFFKPLPGSLVGVAIESNEAVLYLKQTMMRTTRVPLFPAKNAGGYDVFDQYLVISPNPFDSTPELFVVDLNAKKHVPFAKTSTEQFGREGAIFRGTDRYLYRLAGGVLIRSQIVNRRLQDETLLMGMENQVWFDAYSAPDNDFVFGYFRVFSRYEWFLLEDTRQKSIAVSELDAGEVVTDQVVRFGPKSLVLLRKTRLSGREYCRVNVIDLHSGEVLVSQRFDLANDPDLADIHATAYDRLALLVAGEDGLIGYNLQTGTRRVVDQTKGLVLAGNDLWQYEGGLLVVSKNRVTKINLTNK
jgi:hypothetical protein